MAGLGVTGLGCGLPDQVVGNAGAGAACRVGPDWIERRTGILSRRRCSPRVSLSDLATAAGAKAVAAAGRTPDLIVLASTVPERPLPPTACVVQRRLGLPGVPAFDVSSACAGFVYALVAAWGASRVGLASAPLVIGADVFSRYADPRDRRTAPLFGDAAGAVMLGAVPDGRGVIAARLWTDGALSELARLPFLEAGREGQVIPPVGYFQMDGRALREAVLRVAPEVLRACLDDAAVSLADLRRVLLHQANVRLVEALAERLGLSERQVPTCGRLTGNTAAASIPVSLALSQEQEPLAPGDLVALVTVGAGMSAGAVLVRWS